jgi:heptosyltransferase-1
MRKSPKNILVIRSSAIGDIAMASALLPPLAQGFPGARISWLLEPAMKGILAHNEHVDHLLFWPKHEWRRLSREGRWLRLAKDILAFRRALKKEKFELVLDAQGLFRSRLLSWLSGAPCRIGFDSKEPGRFLMTRTISRGGESQQMGSEYLHLAHELQLETGPFHQCLDVGPEDLMQAKAALEAGTVAGPFVAAAPFTTRPQKHWFQERWSELGRQLHRAFGWPMVLLGGPGDREAGAAIAAAAPDVIINLAGHLSLPASMAVVRQAALLVGVDTGMTHMGPAFARPTIALFGSTCPYLHTSRSNTRVIYHKLDCSPCKRNPTCDGAYHCMRAISAREVVEVAQNLLPGEGAPA